MHAWRIVALGVYTWSHLVSKRAMQIYFAELVGSTYEQSWAQNAEGSPEPFDKVRLGSHFFVLSGPEALSFIWEGPSHSIIVWLGSRFLVLSQIPFP